MKLVGNIKDYYDGAATQFGYSDDVIYNRLCEVLVMDGYGQDMTNNMNKLSPHLSKNDKCDFSIGFCGKIYYGLLVNNAFENPTVLFPYIQKDVNTFIELYEKQKKALGRYSSLSVSMMEFARSIGYIKSSHLDTINGQGVNSLDSVENHTIFQDLGCPVFVYLPNMWSKKNHDLIGTPFQDSLFRSPYDPKKGYIPRHWLIKNPILKDFDFGKLVDPYTASQEIEMYLGRLATNNTPPMPVGSDKVIAESKGFDKYSFRKAPSK
jgi:hypothetical protein